MYFSGFNGFCQLKQQGNVKPPNESVEQGTDFSVCSVPQLQGPTDQCISLSDLGNVSFSWTNVFYITVDEKLKSRGLQAGFKGCKLSDFLEKHPISVKTLVTSGNKRVIVQDGHDLLWRHLEGDTELTQLELSQDGLVVQDATEKLLVAMNGQNELYTADLCAELKLSFCQLPGGLSVTSVSCGLEHVVLATTSGQVFSFGNGSRGQLGHGELTVDRVSTPQLVDTLDEIKVRSVACGSWHSTVVTADGDLYVWGWNEGGQLGIPNGKEIPTQHLSSPCGNQENISERRQKRQRTDSGGGDSCMSHEIQDIPLKVIQDIEPVQVQMSPYGLDLPDELKVIKTSCGTRHTCVLFDSGILMTCGWNNYGQLCHGDTHGRDFLETVQCFVDRGERVIDIKAVCWNTAVLTKSVT